MLDIKIEKDRKLTTEEVCKIEDFAIQAANDGGFLNRYIFERALLVFAAIVIYPDHKEDISAMIGEGYDIRVAYDTLLKTGLLDEMFKDYEFDITYLFEVGDTWFADVRRYEHSARGLLDTISTLSGDIVRSAAEQLQSAASGDVQVVQEFAKKWGLGRGQIPGTENAE